MALALGLAPGIGIGRTPGVWVGVEISSSASSMSAIRFAPCPWRPTSCARMSPVAIHLRIRSSVSVVEPSSSWSSLSSFLAFLAVASFGNVGFSWALVPGCMQARRAIGSA
jgi:hypothetical protein